MEKEVIARYEVGRPRPCMRDVTIAMTKSSIETYAEDALELYLPLARSYVVLRMTRRSSPLREFPLFALYDPL
jgi:hypothetical protein